MCCMETAVNGISSLGKVPLQNVTHLQSWLFSHRGFGDFLTISYQF